MKRIVIAGWIDVFAVELCRQLACGEACPGVHSREFAPRGGEPHCEVVVSGPCPGEYAEQLQHIEGLKIDPAGAQTAADALVYLFCPASSERRPGEGEILQCNTADLSSFVQSPGRSGAGLKLFVSSEAFNRGYWPEPTAALGKRVEAHNRQSVEYLRERYGISCDFYSFDAGGFQPLLKLVLGSGVKRSVTASELGEVIGPKQCIEKAAFVFICSEGSIELEACLLCESIRRFVALEHEVWVAVPIDDNGRRFVSADSLAFIEERGARIVEIFNPIAARHGFERLYRHSNKIYALAAVETAAERVIFLDSDSLFVRPLVEEPELTLPMFFRYGSSYTASLFGRYNWEEMFARIDAPLPRERRFFHGEGLPSHFAPPVLAANLIGLCTTLQPLFCRTWEEIFVTLLDAGYFNYPNGTLWYCADEFCLSLTVHKLQQVYGIAVRFSDTAFHYNGLKHELEALDMVRAQLGEMIAGEPALREIYHRLRASKTVIDLGDL